MSLTDRTNEVIYLSMHKPMTDEEDWEAGSMPSQLVVDHDSDSSFEPSSWVCISLTDSDHDSDTIKMTFEEAQLLHDRLSRILGKSIQWGNKYGGDAYSEPMPEERARSLAERYPRHRMLVMRDSAELPWRVVS